MTTVKKPGSVAVYARISSEPDGTALGVKRKVEDCRKLCAQLDWPIGERLRVVD